MQFVDLWKLNNLLTCWFYMLLLCMGIAVLFSGGLCACSSFHAFVSGANGSDKSLFFFLLEKSAEQIKYI